MTELPLETLARYLVGTFENSAQAAADPTWYVHLRLWHQPIPRLSHDQTVTLFLEQANVISGQPPYRQRVLQLRALTEAAKAEHDAAAVQWIGDQHLEGQYFALKDPLKFRGAGACPTMLEPLSESDLVALPNSVAVVQCQPDATGYQFRVSLPEGKLCSFEYGGKTRYVSLGFDIAPYQDTLLLKTYDKGIDPDTGRGLWGALMGPFEMVKQTN